MIIETIQRELNDPSYEQLKATVKQLEIEWETIAIVNRRQAANLLENAAMIERLKRKIRDLEDRY